MYLHFWSDSRSELDTTFLIKDFVSICLDLIFFDVILPLFCSCGHLEQFLQKLKTEINFGWNVTLHCKNVREKRWYKFYISLVYLGMSLFQLGVLLDSFEYSNLYFFVGRPIPFKYTVFGRWFFIKLDYSYLYLF